MWEWRNPLPLFFGGVFIMKGIEEFLFRTFPSARYASGKTEVVIRCPFCGDSKDPNSAHMYISVVEGKPHFFHCFKCNESGVLSGKTLRRMSIYDVETSIDLDSYNKQLKRNSPMVYSRRSFYMKNTYISDTDLSRAKLAYINNRLGLNLNFRDCMENKIVLNLRDLLNQNYINKLTRSPNIVDQLDKCFVGFLSMDNSMVILRKLVPDGQVYHTIDKRYTVYNIFNTEEDTKHEYCVPTTINTLDMTPVRVHIAEGVFDILSIFYNLNGGNRYQNIYYALCGKNYKNKLMSLITEYGLINAEYHIYLDNDIDDYTIQSIAKITIPLKIRVYIHKNRYTGEKDYGVKASNIIDSVYSL